MLREHVTTGQTVIVSDASLAKAALRALARLVGRKSTAGTGYRVGKVRAVGPKTVKLDVAGRKTTAPLRRVVAILAG